MGSMKFIRQTEVSGVLDRIFQDKPDSLIVAYQNEDGSIITTWAGDPLKCVGLASLFCSDMSSNILMDSGLFVDDPNHPSGG